MAIEPDPQSNWDAGEIRRVAHRVADMLADYLEAIPKKPVFAPVPQEAAMRFASEPPPADAVAPDRVIVCEPLNGLGDCTTTMSAIAAAKAPAAASARQPVKRPSPMSSGARRDGTGCASFAVRTRTLK